MDPSRERKRLKFSHLNEVLADPVLVQIAAGFVKSTGLIRQCKALIEEQNPW